MAELKQYNMKLDEEGLPHLVEDGHTKYYVDRRCVYNDQDKIFDLIRSVGCLDDAEESMWVICFDPHLRPIGLFKVASGSSDYCEANIRGIFQRALMTGADQIAVWHNHPSGVLSPSDVDLSITKRLIEAGFIIDIRLVDHMIVSRNGYYSIRKEYSDMGW